MSRKLDVDGFKTFIVNLAKGLVPGARMVIEEVPGLGSRIVIEGGTVARDNLAGFVDSLTTPDLMRSILMDAVGLTADQIEGLGGPIAAFESVNPEGWIFRRKTGTGASYFAIRGVRVKEATAANVAAIFGAPEAPKTAPKGRAKKAAK